MPADVQQVVNTMGLSPAELTGLSGQQVQRDRNLISLLGAASDIKRNRALNLETEARTRMMDPVEIEVDGEKFHTTKGNMTTAMVQMQQRKASQVAVERSEYENQPMQVMIGGAPFNIRRHEFKDISGILAEQERLGQTGAVGERAQQAHDWKAEAITALGGPDPQVTPEIVAKLGAVPGMPGVDAGDIRKEKERVSKLRKDWNNLYIELNQPPESGGKNPLALASSANAIAEELGEPIAAVVFTESYTIPGWADNIPAGTTKMTNLRNPVTGEPMTIKEIREQARADGMILNDALKIMHIHQRMKGIK